MKIKNDFKFNKNKYITNLKKNKKNYFEYDKEFLKVGIEISLLHEESIVL